MNSIGGSNTNPYRLVFATPTISTHGPRMASTRKRLPMGSCPGQYRCANVSFTIATFGEAGVVGRTKITARDNRQPNRVEVALVDDRSRVCRAVLARRKLIALRHDRHRRRQTVHRHVARQRGRLDARHAARLVGDALEEALRLRRAVAELAWREVHHQQMVGAEARSSDELPLEPAIDDGRHHQQHHGDRHLPADQHGAPPASPPPEPRGVGRLHYRRQIGAGRSNRRRESEEQHAQQRHRQTDEHRAPIQVKGGHDRQVGRDLHLPEQHDAGITHAEAEHASRRARSARSR